MLNMMKAEIKRLWLSKGFWISLVVLTGIYVLCIVMQSNAQESMNWTNTSAPAEPGVYLTVDEVVSSLNTLATSFGFSFGILIMGIELAGFVAQEYSSGFVKQTIPLANGRSGIILSKLVVSGFLGITILFVSYGVGALLGPIFMQDFVIEPAATLFSSMVLLFLFALAFFSLETFVCTLFRNKTSGIVIDFLVASGMLLGIGQSLLAMVDLDGLATYTLSNYLMHITDEVTDFSLNTVLVLFVYLIVYNGLSLWISHRRDI